MKYPRTYHLDFSPGVFNDDKVQYDLSLFYHYPIVITAKMDGSNTCMSPDGCFARSHSDCPKHPSFDMFKAEYYSKKYLLDSFGVSIFGEWLYAKHSILYTELPSFWNIFAVLKDSLWLDWVSVEEYSDKLGYPTVPVLFKGIIKNYEELKNTVEKTIENNKFLFGGPIEGVVVRTIDGFSIDSFSYQVVKWVRKGHIQTSDHWKHEEIIRNKIKGYNEI